jgi:hypothetical protein
MGEENDTKATKHHGSSWTAAVAVRVGNGQPEYIHDAFEALEALEPMAGSRCVSQRESSNEMPPGGRTSQQQ